MVAINQRIPNFIGGVSQQPDTLKYPGQLRVCDNAVPDVTFGLVKRPPGEFLATLSGVSTASDSYWYENLRDSDEKFLIQIIPSDYANEPIRVWNLTPVVVNTSTQFYDQVPVTWGTTNYYANGATIPIGTRFNVSEATTGSYDYLNGAGKPGVLTLQDYTLVTNPNKVVAESSSNNAEPIVTNAKYAFASLETLAYNNEYVVYSGDDAPSTHNYYRVTSLSVQHYDSTGDTDEWDEGGGGADNNDHALEGNTYIKNHGTLDDQENLGQYNGVLVWDMNGDGPNAYSSNRINCDLIHVGSKRYTNATDHPQKQVGGKDVSYINTACI